MRKTKTIIGVLMAISVCLVSPQLWAAGPRISFEQEIVNMGTVPFGQKVKVHFAFSNLGDGPLAIRAVEADCSCSDTFVTNADLPAGGRGEIVLVLDTAKLPMGKNGRHIHVVSNDPQRSLVKLMVIVDVVPQ